MQVGKYLLDDHRVLNASNHFDGAAACTARCDVNIDKSAGEPICTAIGCSVGVRYKDAPHENPLQSLGPGHRCTAFGGRLVWCLIRHFDLVAFAPLCGCYLHTMFAVRCKHTVTDSSGMNLDSYS